MHYLNISSLALGAIAVSHLVIVQLVNAVLVLYFIFSFFKFIPGWHYAAFSPTL